MSTTWHVEDGLLERYGREPRLLDPASAASAEAHLVHCARCRAVIADHGDEPELALVWTDVLDEVDRPRLRLVERLLTSLGVRAEVARVAGATAGMQLAWTAAVISVLALVVLAVRHGAPPVAFVAIAPLVPLGAVALSFDRAAEPGGEAVLATPISATALLLRRASAVLLVSLLCLAVGGLALPGVPAAAAAWVLPSLALTLTALAGGTWRPVEHVAAVLASGWLAAVGLSHLVGGLDVGAAPLGGPVQVVAVAVAIASGGVVVRRRHHLIVIGVRP